MLQGQEAPSLGAGRGAAVEREILGDTLKGETGREVSMAGSQGLPVTRA